MLIYNCEKKTLKTPDWLYSKESNKHSVVVDGCLSEEIKNLWSKGIHTRGCCCGHGVQLGVIQVDDEDIHKMYELGYQNYIYDDQFGSTDRKDGFIPKTVHHIYNGYCEGFQG